MAVDVKIEGMAEISEMLTKLETDAPKMAARMLYRGAAEVMNEVKRQEDAIETTEFRYASRGGTRKPSPEEKAVIQGKAGIAKFDKNGSEIGTSIGYGNSGYAMLKDRRVPVAKIANSINSGTSFMKKQPFIRKAANAAGRRAEEAMKAEFDRITEEITGG